MAHSSHLHQPTLRHLLTSEAMAEAQVLYGQDLLNRRVAQVVTSLNPPPRSGSLVVLRSETLTGKDLPALKDLTAVVVIQPYMATLESSLSAAIQPGHGLATSVGLDVEIQRLLDLCTKAEVALLLLPGFGEVAQVAEEIRQAFLQEVRRTASHLHAHLLSLVLAEGLSGLVEEVSSSIDRPLAIETCEFKLLASKQMGSTPANQQSTVSDEAKALVNRHQASLAPDNPPRVCLTPIRVGRRLVIPITLQGVVVGYLSAMVRPKDDLDSIIEFLQPAALAAMIDFSHRQKDASLTGATHKSLLKDLLSGRSLSASDQERLERHFGFDLCDGFSVFALQVTPGPIKPGKTVVWPEEPNIFSDLEGTKVYVVPYHKSSEASWLQEAEKLVALLKKLNGNLQVQLGASRINSTMLDLSESYREARQALIIGSMMHGEAEFVVGYGDLGVRRLLYLITDHPELDRFYEENLAPLEAYDAEWESELVDTLSVYLRQGANLNSAARSLFIHRHTLRYRLEQIAEILKVDIDSQDVLLNLQIAFLIKELKGRPNA